MSGRVYVIGCVL